MRNRIGGQRGVELARALTDTDQLGQPVGALADVVAHQARHVLIPTRRDQCLDDEVATWRAALRQPPSDDQQQVGDGPVRVGGEEVGEHSSAVCPQGPDQQLGFGAEVGVERAVAHAGGAGDLGPAGAVVATTGEHLRGGLQQPVAGLLRGYTGDASHGRIKRPFISLVKAGPGMTLLESVVVVGAGLAGLRTAERLREDGFTGAITLVGEETEPPYDRPPLSKQVLRGEREVVRLRDPESYAELAVELRLGVRAASLDIAARRIVLDDGTGIDYQALVIATGAQPRTLGGAPQDGVHLLRTAEDSRRLRTAASRTRRAVVVGGGFIGCEGAASLRLMGLDVTIVELASAPLVGVLGDQLSAEVVRVHQSNGVTIRCGVGVD